MTLNHAATGLDWEGNTRDRICAQTQRSTSGSGPCVLTSRMVPVRSTWSSTATRRGSPEALTARHAARPGTARSQVVRKLSSTGRESFGSSEAYIARVCPVDRRSAQSFLLEDCASDARSGGGLVEAPQAAVTASAMMAVVEIARE